MEKLPGGIAFPVLTDLHKREILGLATLIHQHHGGAAALLHIVSEGFQVEPQPVRFLGGEFKDSLFHAPGRKTGNLPAEQRRNTLQTLLQTAGEFNLPGFTAQFFDDCIRRYFQQIEFFSRRRRQGIGQPGQNGTHRRHGCVDALDGIHDLPIRAADNQIAVPSHDLHAESQGHMVAQLINGIKIQLQNTVQSCLAHLSQLG